MFWQLLGLLGLGLIVGALGRLFVRTGARLGCLGTVLIGVVGVYVGGTLGAIIFDERLDLRQAHTFLGALAGAIVSLLIVKLVVGTSRRRPVRGPEDD